MDLIKTWLENLRDPLIAGIRTGTAAAVTWLITWLVGLGITVPEGAEVAFNTVLFGLVALAYNFVVSLLERYVHPIFGVLVLIPKAPVYPKKDEVLVAHKSDSGTWVTDPYPDDEEF